MKLSKTMNAVINRLLAGDGTVVVKQGGYWLPGDIVPEEISYSASGHEWYLRAVQEFDANVGTNTIYALANRGLLEPIDKGAQHKVRYQLTQEAKKLS